MANPVFIASVGQLTIAVLPEEGKPSMQLAVALNGAKEVVDIDRQKIGLFRRGVKAWLFGLTDAQRRELLSLQPIEIASYLRIWGDAMAEIGKAVKAREQAEGPMAILTALRAA